MKAFFKELFEYNHHFNQKLIAIATENAESVSEKYVALQSHILNSHQVWNCKFQPGRQPYSPWDIHPLRDLSAIDKNNFEASMLILDTFELNQNIQYTTTRGQAFNNSVRDILFQVINHSTYHRGQIATLFRQCGIEPVLTDYIFYKWNKA
ncbi:MAG TPA: DinB family protein [Chitinophaga sp.]|uniref:DinB family protein n=1 Tax=Chitinophaga sp. TaxID=1869181 RepID=UPI002DBEB7D2|nr:DinB family protein [Chitinophaga sp.]HEU4551702.1 DinB family protein [Chitinophaga sp.]